ncbi:V-type proton ATPase subunit S1-like [Teleopsis dalmanni]|uniref:V-type proton ATPase subunit S1-like n=1 Tax=Teleopsis dalmanni TaxID=139649 RepID=UPI0018CE57B7|nr:V-type proton ATPase subunit S1-like [Teleopsis dalmanni]
MLARTLIATFLCVIGVALAEISPVFLWGANSPVVPALQTINTDDFGKIIAPYQADHMIVAFQEENLANSDFLCANEKTSQSCYAHLQGVPQKTFYANVENPSDALRAISKKQENNYVTKTGELQSPISCEAGKVVLVNFENSLGERAAALESHDAAISAITKFTKCPTVYLYMSSPKTAAAAAQKRVRRDAAPSGTMFRNYAQFLIFWTKLSYVSGNGNTAEDIIINSMDITNTSSSKFNVNLKSSTAKSLTFDITLSGGYFSMSNLKYDSNGFTIRNGTLEAPTDLSYFCGNVTLNGTTSGSLIWNSLQFQAPFGSTKDTNFMFGDAWHCVGFFTPGILSGLFVVLIFLAIIFTGVCWMMDINTMDRFDDPKGKTITINAAAE